MEKFNNPHRLQSERDFLGQSASKSQPKIAMVGTELWTERGYHTLTNDLCFCVLGLSCKHVSSAIRTSKQLQLHCLSWYIFLSWVLGRHKGRLSMEEKMGLTSLCVEINDRWWKSVEYLYINHTIPRTRRDDFFFIVYKSK